jgi:hypothetical protein
MRSVWPELAVSRLLGEWLTPMMGPLGDHTGQLAAFCVVANVAEETASGEGACKCGQEYGISGRPRRHPILRCAASRISSASILTSVSPEPSWQMTSSGPQAGAARPATA